MSRFDSNSIFDPYMGQYISYNQYLKTPWWIERRRLKLQQQPVCEFHACTVGTKLIIHHLSYKNFFGERDSELQVLCHFHHMVRELQKKKCARCTRLLVASEQEATEILHWAMQEGRGGGFSMLNSLVEDLNELCADCEYLIKQVNAYVISGKV